MFWPVARVRKENWETVGERQLIGHGMGVGGVSRGVGNNERTHKKTEKERRIKKKASEILFGFSLQSKTQSEVKNRNIKSANFINANVINSCLSHETENKHKKYILGIS